ncbi:MAG: restriction endonuclease subunit S [Melioribacteraceae bacterium]|jgi:type I restriction enzyme S subunit|nr:restriction endonuclease subunit S [Melioribacteraceae bacterium]
MVENQTQTPSDWVEKTLNNVCNISKGVQLNKLNLQNSGSFPCINGGISPSGYTENWNRDANTITISEGGNSCGFVNLIDTKFWSGGHCYSLGELKSTVKNEFLFYALKGRQNLIMDLRVGSGLPNIQQKAIKKFSFILPKSKTEQQKISEILSKVDIAIEQTEKLIAKYNRIKTGLMQDLLTKGIDENGNIRNEETHEFKDSELGRIPVEWAVKRLNNCIKRSSTITYGIVQTFEHIEDGIPVLRTIDLKENGINPISQLLRTKKTISDRYKRTILEANDIVCNVRASVGDFNLVSKEYTGCNTTRGVARICPSVEYNNGFLVWFLKSKTNEHQMDLLIKGTTFIDINIADLRQIYVLIPHRNEQDAIQSKLDKIQLTIDDYNKQLKKNKSIKTALMQDLLSGKKRVTSLLKEEANDS